MSYIYNFVPIPQTMGHFFSISANRNQSMRLQETYKLREEIFPDPTLSRIMGPITARISGIMRVQGKDIPEKNRLLYLRENVPYGGSCSPLGLFAFCWPFEWHTPALDVSPKMYVICESKPCPTPSTVAKVAPYPQEIDFSPRRPPYPSPYDAKRVEQAAHLSSTQASG